MCKKHLYNLWYLLSLFFCKVGWSLCDNYEIIRYRKVGETRPFHVKKNFLPCYIQKEMIITHL